MLLLDKPQAITSNAALMRVKRMYRARKAGHTGTLDPLASGGLPIALGEATKTVPFVMDGRKRYRFTVAWGEERDTDDTEGRVTQTSALRPSAEAIRDEASSSWTAIASSLVVLKRVDDASPCRKVNPSPSALACADGTSTW